MAGKKQRKRRTSTPRARAPEVPSPAPPAEKPAEPERVPPNWLPLLACVGLFCLYAAYGLASDGTFNDDDMTRYFHTRDVFDNPRQAVNLWNRPAFVLLNAFPAQLGYWAIELMTALVCALTCWFSYQAAKALGLRHAWLAIPFVGLQPFFLMLSFSALTEPLGACLIAAALWALFRERPYLSAALAGALPLARTELGLLLAVWGVALLMRKQWKACLLLALGLLAWNTGGWLSNGDPLFLYHQTFTGAARLYAKSSVWHYPQTFIFIVGPVLFGFVGLGLLDAALRKKVDLVLVSFVLMFAAYIYLSAASSAGQAAGFLRHFVSLAPLVALIALRGCLRWLQAGRELVWSLVVLLASAGVCYAWMSVELVKSHAAVGPEEYSKLAVLLALSVVCGVRLLAGAPALSRVWTLRLLAAVVFLHSGYALLNIGPIHLSPEHKLIRQVADWYREQGLHERPTLCNHVWFHNFSGIDWNDQTRNPRLKNKSMRDAATGSIVVWEPHYGRRLAGDVQAQDLADARDWRVLRGFVDIEGGALAVVLEKLPAEAPLVQVSAEGLQAEALGLSMDLQGLPGWSFGPRTEGLRLLTGWNASLQLGFELRLDRFLASGIPPQSYPAVVKQQIEQGGTTRFEQATRSADGQWTVLQLRTGERAHQQWIAVSEARGEGLLLSFSYPPELQDAAQLCGQIAERLRFEPWLR